jgi:endonuclease YncB( thermonuclease family)
MVRILREMVREVVLLPLPIKFFVALAITAIFVVVTQWEQLPFNQPHVADTPKMSISPQQSDQRSFDSPEAPPTDKAHAAPDDAPLIERMASIVIKEPNVHADGSILGNGQTLYLYGIKQFDSKKLCTRASGERWACGLHAYAGFRNAIAKKTIICDLRRILQNGISAICRIGKTNIALALVRDGLVELDDNVEDAEMLNAQAFAKSRKLGIWDR